MYLVGDRVGKVDDVLAVGGPVSVCRAAADEFRECDVGADVVVLDEAGEFL